MARASRVVGSKGGDGGKSGSGRKSEKSSGRPREVAGSLAREYCQKFPDTGTRTLANMLYRDHPETFTSWENCRSAVRYYRGEKGDFARDSRAADSTVSTSKESRLQLPDSDAAPVLPLPFTTPGKGVICGDIHLPYHDKRALEATLEHAIAKGYTDWMILNGDIIDSYQLSRWVRDPKARDWPGELEIAKSFLSEVRSVWKRVIYKLGNHERRWWDYMRIKAPELVGLTALEFDELTDLKRLDIDYVAPNRVIHAGELTILHGHEYGGSLFSPVNPARGAFIRGHACMVTGHLHRGSHHPEPDVRGRVMSCWSHGCLCDLHPEYAPLNKWDHSFLMMDWDGDWFEIQLKKVISGKVT